MNIFSWLIFPDLLVEHSNIKVAWSPCIYTCTIKYGLNFRNWSLAHFYKKNIKVRLTLNARIYCGTSYIPIILVVWGVKCLLQLVWNVRNDQGTVLEVLNLNNCSCRGCFFVCFFLNKYIDLNWLKIINARPSVDLSFFGLNSLPLTQLTEITIYFCQIIYLISAHINICI